jgi:uncharacterized lipoprotein YbaY
MKRWLALFAVLLSGCALTPEQGTPMQKLTGTLTFPQTTALPATATAHIVVVPALSGSDSKPVAQGDFPARTSSSIPFELKFPASNITTGSEYLVLAQILDHGKVWYSNLSTPERISFGAEPGDLLIELRKESF